MEAGELDRLRSRAAATESNPRLTVIANREGQRTKAAYRKDLVPEERIGLINELTKQINELRDGLDPAEPTRAVDAETTMVAQGDTPPPQQPQQQPPPLRGPEAPEWLFGHDEEHDDDDDEDTAQYRSHHSDLNLTAVPDRFEHKYKKLRDFFDEHKGRIARGNEGELVIDGKSVEGSNYDQLIRMLYQQNKAYRTTGKKELIRVLAEMNLPHTMISNSTIIASLRTLKRTLKTHLPHTKKKEVFKAKEPHPLLRTNFPARPPPRTPSPAPRSPSPDRSFAPAATSSANRPHRTHRVPARFSTYTQSGRGKPRRVLYLFR